MTGAARDSSWLWTPEPVKAKREDGAPEVNSPCVVAPMNISSASNNLFSTVLDILGSIQDTFGNELIPTVPTQRIMFAIRECHRLLDRTQELATVGFLPSQINRCTSGVEELQHFPPFYCCNVYAITVTGPLRATEAKGLRRSAQISNVCGFG
ncbi:hypothetical protein llap_4735 [Limosa lapponica baueri]|uniref:Uncharacterized protein n=1 Tax=Limosa lapponica baueri TaxID=1758121 RepID=A0A2I0UFY7_LIMLA|nr:hypothetical protein llap_4735 [Limosa lapponica baueri]